MTGPFFHAPPFTRDEVVRLLEAVERTGYVQLANKVLLWLNAIDAYNRHEDARIEARLKQQGIDIDAWKRALTKEGEPT